MFTYKIVSENMHNMFALLCIGIWIGLLFGVPVGAVGTLTLQRTWIHGKQAGLITGLGSSIADSTYAFIGVSSFTILSNFLLTQQNYIHTLGGIFICYIAIQLLYKKDNRFVKENANKNYIKMFLSSFMIGITNPIAIMTFIFAFSWFNISASLSMWNRFILILGVFIGTYTWWILLSYITSFCKTHAKNVNLNIINKVCGSILLLFGIVILSTTLSNLL